MTRYLAVATAVLVLGAALGGVASGVRGGRPVTIQRAPWAVVVMGLGQETCSGVIIDPLHVLTAGHCLYDEPYGKRVPASWFTIEAGVSNFSHPLVSDVPQIRNVSSTRLMPGYIPSSRQTPSNGVDAGAHDLAVLTLSRPLDLNGGAARAVRLPSPDARRPVNSSVLMEVGFGRENPRREPMGPLNELVEPRILEACVTSLTLCAYSTTSGVCPGDSGSGLVEPGPPATVVGILNQSLGNCLVGRLSYYIYLGSPAVQPFIKG